MNNSGWVHTDEPLRLEVAFFVKAPLSFKSTIQYRTKRPDLTNYAKLIEDTLNGVVIKDDSFIVEIEAKKYEVDAEYYRPQSVVELIKIS